MLTWLLGTSPNDAWKAALAKAKAELGDKDYATFVSGHTFALCLQAITKERACSRHHPSWNRPDVKQKGQSVGM